jgi:transcriptional regulator with XRE-family HTH domain
MTIGKRIKKLRCQKMNMSQVSFADSINVSKQTLYKYENDIVTNIPADKIEAIASLCNVSPAYLMGWENNPERKTHSETILETGQRMKFRRKELEIPVEDIAKALNISVATVYRYEKGDIEKVPGKILEPLSKILKTTPAYLMVWEDNPERKSPEEITLKVAQKMVEEHLGLRAPLTQEETYINRINGLLEFFERLNVKGQLEAIKRVEELTYIHKYINSDTLKKASEGHRLNEKPLDRACELGATHKRDNIKIPD